MMTNLGRPSSTSQKKLVLFLVILGLYFVGVAVTLNRVEFIRLKSDLYLRWYATVKLVEDGRNIYDGRNSQEVDQIVYGRDSGLSSGFYYPASLLILMRPLAALPYPTAHIIWTIFVQALYLAALLTLSQFVRWPPTVNQQTVFITAVIFAIPNIQHTIWGQFNTIGILSLALTFIALCQRRYGLAGLLAIGLTIKPQGQLLTLLFFLIWAVCRRERWRFLLGFAAGGFFLWLVAEMMQPGWVFAFWASLDDYLPATSAIDMLWNPYQIVSLLLITGTIVLFFWKRQVAADSPTFTGVLVLSLAVWMLVVPIVGMFHVLILPLGIILLMAYYRQASPRHYRRGIITWVFIYLLGWVGFLIGLSQPELYGSHILWSEFTYKVLLPLAAGAMSLPLVFGKNGPAFLEIRN
ncbi:MAG TPA: glycosyltransferase family 87 protein [Chloroflexota bacterium]|nr:glycosyltransferase family 87 protein [Chloroflexota bacterium]HUM70018.1 glycosyltransferase family 87 protein [Chloroflexota bacterium]